VITGATGGIGKALALHYAKPGVTLALTGRNKQNLDDVARECESRCVAAPRSVGARAAGRAATCAHWRSAALPRSSGATVKKGALDVTDQDGMAKFLLAVDKAAPVECVRSAAATPGLARARIAAAPLR
jgi:NADP-dependent 3-hydroxy acid dehydrogenase YdfG